MHTNTRVGSTSGVIFVFMAGMFLAGCATPYVSLEPAKVVKRPTNPTLPEGLAYAQGMHDLYREKAIALGDEERNLSNGLITLGTTLLGLSAAKAHSSAIAGTTILGGAAYTFGRFNIDKRRPQIYVAGMKAVECAMSAVGPLNFDPRTADELTRLDKVLESQMALVARQIAAVETAARNYQDAGGNEATIKFMAARVDAARVSIVSARQARDLSNQLLQFSWVAGKELSDAVQSIDTAVLDELRGTENSIQAVPQILAQLAKSGDIFSALAKPAAAVASTAADAASPKSSTAKKLLRMPQTGAAKSALPDIDTAVDALEAGTIILDTTVSHLVGIASIIDQKKARDSLKACNVETVVKRIALDKSTLTFTKANESQSIAVTGGKGNYSVHFDGSVTGVTFAVAGGFVTVTTAATLNAGEYTLWIGDDIQVPGERVSIVVKAESVDADTSSTKSVSAKLKEKIDALKTVKVKGATVTLVASTVTKLDVVQVTYTVEAGKTVTDAEVRDALAAEETVKAVIGTDTKKIVPVLQAATPKSAAVKKSASGGAVVDGLTQNEIKTIQEHLCSKGDSVDGIWGSRTQEKLADFRAAQPKDSKAKANTVELTSVEASQLLGKGISCVSAPAQPPTKSARP